MCTHGSMLAFNQTCVASINHLTCVFPQGQVCVALHYYRGSVYSVLTGDSVLTADS